MASAQFFSILTIAAILVPSILATELLVGDETGWDTNHDYKGWTRVKEFHVGDQLVFKYIPGAHTVIEVNGTDFQQCVASAGTKSFTSRYDVIILTTPGEKWYICSIDEHCKAGEQKLAIIVLDQTVSPTTPSNSATRGSVAPIYYCWKITIFCILVMFMV